MMFGDTDLTETLKQFVGSDPESVSPDAVAEAAGSAAKVVAQETDHAYTANDSSAGELYSIAGGVYLHANMAHINSRLSPIFSIIC